MQESLAEMRFVSYLNLDLNGCNPRRIADKDTILDFSQQACDLLETTPIKEASAAVRFGLGSHAEGFSLVLVTSMRDVLVAHFAELTHSAYVDWKWMSHRLKPVVQQQIEGMRSLSKELFGAEALVVALERYCDNPKVVVRDTNKYGLAPFAGNDILAGELIAFFDGEIYEADRASDIPNDPPIYIQEHVLQFDSRRWRYSSGFAKLVSHSCEPNCGIKDRFKVVAMRKILKGEELSFDYDMSENSDWKLECRCDSPACRGLISGFRNLPWDKREKYKGFISGYLVPQKDEAFEQVV